MHALTVLVAADAVEAVSDLFSDDCEALSVSVEDADAGSAAEQPVFDEPGTGPTGRWQHARVTALFTDEAQATVAAAAFAADRGSEGRVESIGAVDEQDWVRTTQAQFGPTEIARGFWIVPTWSDVPGDAERVIRLDPGMAFGTGTHPTTRMCLRWVARHAEAERARWQRVLDYGCGSGVLAIAALLHGARQADAVDIDPAAVEATRANAEANGVGLMSGLPADASGRYGLVLANILATPLKLLAPVLASHLEPGASLVLSGILERQADELRTAYAPWLAIDVAETDDGWILMTGRLPATAAAA